MMTFYIAMIAFIFALLGAGLAIAIRHAIYLRKIEQERLLVKETRERLEQLKKKYDEHVASHLVTITRTSDKIAMRYQDKEFPEFIVDERRNKYSFESIAVFDGRGAAIVDHPQCEYLNLRGVMYRFSGKETL